jgi:hypothetical protein
MNKSAKFGLKEKNYFIYLLLLSLFRKKKKKKD